MSNFIRKTKHPITGNYENAWWLDGYFAGRNYGIKFPSGEIFDERDYEWKYKD